MCRHAATCSTQVCNSRLRTARCCSLACHHHVLRTAERRVMLSCQQAAELLSEGRAKHDRGDRMGAVMMYEKALKKVWTVPPRERC
jgi:hypothetical protein